MAILLTAIVVLLVAAWVSRAYPAPTFIDSLVKAVQALIDWVLGAIRR